MYEREIDKDAIHWDRDQVAEYLRQRCLHNPPSPYQAILLDVWRRILGPFFEKHSPRKQRVVLVGGLAEVDAIWVQVGALHLPISDACSAIAFVLSICLPPFPSDDWLSIAVVFVHFCSLASQDSLPRTVRILWHSQPLSPSSDHSSSYLSPEHVQRQRQDETRAIILIDDTISNTRATSISTSSDLPPDPYDTYGPSHDAINNESNSKPKILRLPTPEELLDSLGLRDVWRHWDLPAAFPDAGVGSQIPRGPYSDFDSNHERWPHSCRCSPIMPIIHVLGAQKLVRGVAFAFNQFSFILQEYIRENVPHSALQDTVEPWCEACRFMYERIGVRFKDVASIPAKVPLAFVSYNEADVSHDFEFPEDDFAPPTRPSSPARAPMDRFVQDVHPALPPSSPHTFPPHMPPRSKSSSSRALPNQVSSDRDSATPPKTSTSSIQRSWMRSQTVAPSRDQTSNQQAQTQQSKGGASFNTLNSHARPSPTPPMPGVQSEATGERLGQFGAPSERRRSPLAEAPIQASGPYHPPRPSSAEAGHLHNWTKADTGSDHPPFAASAEAGHLHNWTKADTESGHPPFASSAEVGHLHNWTKADTESDPPPFASGYAGPRRSPRSRARSLTQQQAPILPGLPHPSPPRPKKHRSRPAAEESHPPHYQYMADQPPSPIDARRMHVPRSESTPWTMYQPAAAPDAPNYYPWGGQQQQPPIAGFPKYPTASAASHWQSSPPYPSQHHHPQPYVHGPQWPTPYGYPTDGYPSRLPTMPSSYPHFLPAQYLPRHHDYEQHSLYSDGQDYEVVRPQLPMQQQQNYRRGPAFAPPYQTYVPRTHHQQPKSRAQAMLPEAEYNYNDDTRMYEKVRPFYPE